MHKKTDAATPVFIHNIHIMNIQHTHTNVEDTLLTYDYGAYEVGEEFEMGGVRYRVTRCENVGPELYNGVAGPERHHIFGIAIGLVN